MTNFNLDNLSEIIDEVLAEFCVTYPIPDFNSKEQLEYLRSVLEQFGAATLTDEQLMEAISLAPKKFSLEAAPKKQNTTNTKQSQASKEAEKLHLVHLGYGRYGKKKGGVVTHTTDKKTGRLVPVNRQQVAPTKKVIAPQQKDPTTTKANLQKLAQLKQQVADKKAKDAAGKGVSTKNRIIGGKDKTLANVNTLKSKAFLELPKPNGAGFDAKNKKFAIVPPYKLPKEITQNVKVPPRHLVELVRMMNTKFDNQTAKWSHFSDLPGGAGQISAQAGELMTMIGTTLDDKQAQIFYNSLLEHEKKQIATNPKLANDKDRIVTKSWIQAAMNNRKAIRNRLSKEYPGAIIEAGAWDTEGEVEALGLKDYKKNKGFSSDVYFKIKTKDGKELLDEVSLKKSTLVNFLNSGTGKLLEWDPKLPDDINPNVYQSQERKDLFKFGTANVRRLQNAIGKSKEAQAVIKSKKMDLKTALDKLKVGKGSRDTNKVVMVAIQAAAENGDKASQQYLDLVQKKHKKHQQAVISALGTNKKLKEGMLSAIREEFPLKAVGEGEESMAIGPNSLDRAILQNIFQTSDFEEIKQGLVAMTKEDPPYLAYRAGAKGKVIPIATIVAREDGVGYGGQIKFEMQLDRRFAKILEQANKEIYG